MSVVLQPFSHRQTQSGQLSASPLVPIPEFPQVLGFLMFLQVAFWFGPYSKPLFHDSVLRPPCSLTFASHPPVGPTKLRSMIFLCPCHGCLLDPCPQLPQLSLHCFLLVFISHSGPFSISLAVG